MGHWRPPEGGHFRDMETPMPTAKVTTVNFHLVKHCPMACNFCYARFEDVIRDT